MFIRIHFLEDKSQVFHHGFRFSWRQLDPYPWRHGGGYHEKCRPSFLASQKYPSEMKRVVGSFFRWLQGNPLQGTGPYPTWESFKKISDSNWVPFTVSGICGRSQGRVHLFFRGIFPVWCFFLEPNPSIVLQKKMVPSCTPQKQNHSPQNLMEWKIPTEKRIKKLKHPPKLLLRFLFGRKNPRDPPWKTIPLPHPPRSNPLSHAWTTAGTTRDLQCLWQVVK